jgi:hypothetical protein
VPFTQHRATFGEFVWRDGAGGVLKRLPRARLGGSSSVLWASIAYSLKKAGRTGQPAEREPAL